LLFDVPIAEADHGAPWEIWSVRTDGTGSRQLTHMSERTPVPTWSRDGKWLAIDGGNGLSIVDAATGQATLLASTVYGGGIVWLS
jgi:Tol biopolymer transport system component